MIAPIQPSENNGLIRDTKGRFTLGNPGKPAGAVNHTTRIRNQALSLIGRHQMRMLKKSLSQPATFLYVMKEIIIPLMGRGAQIHIGDNVETNVTQTNNYTQARQIVKQFNPEMREKLKALLSEARNQ
jgi:hypothetical protein